MDPVSRPVDVPFYQAQHLPDESFRFLEVDSSFSGCSWHFHPEYQLGLVLHGFGTCIVGDDVHPISAGELTLLGENLPHVWHFDPRQRDGGTQMYVVHFRKDFLGSDFFHKPDMRDIRLLLTRASLGLQATGSTRDEAESVLRRMATHEGFDRLMDLLSLLRLLAKSSELKTMCSAGFQPVAADLEVERLRCVCEHVQAHFADHVDRDTVAALAHLSPSAFSRFFKRHTGRTFQEYVNEVRIGFACRMLMDEELNVTQIALRTGYGDVTAFNRSFRRLKSMSPTEYRNRMAVVREASPLSKQTADDIDE